MRNRIAHGYEDIDPVRIWDTVHHNLPPLRDAIQRMLAVSRGDPLP
jgi:uncharacterized protein with HEPN domain